MEPETFQHKALDVKMPDENFDPNCDPEDGEQYLMKVIYERQRCPGVVVKRRKTFDEMSKSNASICEEESDIVDTSVCGRPTREWKRLQLIDFSGIRKTIAKCRLHLQNAGYTTEAEMPLVDESEQWQNFCQQNQPVMSIVLRIDQRTMEQLLEFESSWLKDTLAVEEIPDLAISAHWLGAWIYSTFACLQLPLEPQVHSTLREIAKSCIELRNRLSPDHVKQSLAFNVFILIVSKFFNQLDLAKYL